MAKKMFKVRVDWSGYSRGAEIEHNVVRSDLETTGIEVIEID